jgi:hypothetical protein
VNVHPADFSAKIDNPRWPMTAGSRRGYRVTDAEDQSRVLALDGQVQVRAGHFTHVLMTEDFSPIEPDVSVLRFCARGSVQAVLALDVSGGSGGS